ncbi:MAG: SIS domain-containing protein [Peptococcaceae bacterium]|nr:SIS domain-containing protein [Peptococcaceae bacterium]
MSKISFAQHYFKTAISILEEIIQDEQSNLDRAADLITQSLTEGGVLHIFGAGHSHLFAEELAFRAGGLVAINPILEYGYTLMGGSASRSTQLERLEGYSKIVLENYHLRPKEVIIITSQSGINPGPIEAALSAKEKGLFVVALTSMHQSSKLSSRHSSGKKLFEIADVVLDNHVPSGDAVIELQTDFPKVAAVSTVTGAAILQSLVAEVAHRLLRDGIQPPIWISSNVPAGDEHNNKLASQYPSRLKSF